MKTQCLRCGQSTHMVDECPLPVLPDDRRLGPATSRTLEKEMDEQPKDAALRLAARQEKGPWLLTYQDAAESATLLRTQHADIERKDALLRQALDALEKSRPLAYHFDAWEEALRALNKELSK